MATIRIGVANNQKDSLSHVESVINNWDGKIVERPVSWRDGRSVTILTVIVYPRDGNSQFRLNQNHAFLLERVR